MFALPSDYVTAQDAGKAFADEYYGRLNESAESVVDMFAERSRYYSMDSLNGRPAVGRADVAREVRRFLGTYSGGRRFVRVVSVDAQIDGDGGGGGLSREDSGEMYSDVDDDYYDGGCSDRTDTDYDIDDAVDQQHLAVFVRAEWTDTDERRSLPPLPFVQTFRVRCLGPADHSYGFEIAITVVKTMVATVQPPPPQTQRHHQLQRRPRLPDANRLRKGFSNSGRGKNHYKTPIIGQFNQESYAGYAKHLNAEAREFDPTTQSTDDELELSDDEYPDLDAPNEPLSTEEQFLDYQNMVKAFLAKPMAEHHRRRSPTPAADDDDGDDGDNDADDRPTDLLHVDGLDKSITADQLYAAFSRYGKVQWVRVLPGGRGHWLSGSGHPYHSARVCFDRAESVDRLMADHRSPGCTIGGVRVSFSRSRPGQ